jgi:hypothetical protein
LCIIPSANCGIHSSTLEKTQKKIKPLHWLIEKATQIKPDYPGLIVPGGQNEVIHEKNERSSPDTVPAIRKQTGKEKQPC